MLRGRNWSSSRMGWVGLLAQGLLMEKLWRVVLIKEGKIVVHKTLMICRYLVVVLVVWLVRFKVKSRLLEGPKSVWKVWSQSRVFKQATLKLMGKVSRLHQVF